MAFNKVKKSLYISLLGLLGLLLSFTYKTSNNDDLILEISGITEIKGNVMIALFEQKEGFPDEKYSFKKLVLKVSKATMKINLKDYLNEGISSFAVALYHDKNANERLDKNIFGMPTEKYGFSNNARGTFGPPSFEAAIVSRNSTNHIAIQVK